MRWPCPSPAYASKNSFLTSTYQEIPLDEVLTNVTHLVGNDVPVTKAERLQLGDELYTRPARNAGCDVQQRGYELQATVTRVTRVLWRIETRKVAVTLEDSGEIPAVPALASPPIFPPKADLAEIAAAAWASAGTSGETLTELVRVRFTSRPSGSPNLHAGQASFQPGTDVPYRRPEQVNVHQYIWNRDN